MNRDTVEREKRRDKYMYLEQSTSGETETDKVIPQFAGRSLASWAFRFTFLASALMHSQAAFLSADVVVADASADAPTQQADGGLPLPFTR